MNRSKLLATVAVLVMVFAAFAVISFEDESNAASNEYDYNTNLGDSINPGVPQEYKHNAAVTVNDDLTIPAGATLKISGAKFTVNDGVTVTIESGGKLIITTEIDNATYNPDVTINGSIVVESGADFINDSLFDATTQKGAVINGKVIVEEGGRLASTTDGVAGSFIVKNGATLETKVRSSTTSIVEDQNIYLYDGSSLKINGFFNDVMIQAIGDSTYYTAGKMTIDSEKIKDTEGNRTVSDLEFTVTTQTTPAYNEDTKITVREYILNIDGKLDGIAATDGKDAIRDKLSVVAGVSKAKTGGVYTDATFAEVDEDGNKDSSKTLIPLTSITGNLRITANAELETVEGTYTIVSGAETIDAVKDAKAAQDLVKIDGISYVTGSVLMDGYSLYGSGASGMIIIDGGEVDMTNFTPANGLYLYGAYYTDDTNDNPVTHIRDLDVAVKEAAEVGVEDVTVCAYTSGTITDVDSAVQAGAYVVDVDITIPDNMTLNFGTTIVIMDGITFTFSSESDVYIIDEYLNGAKIAVVGGKLIDNGGLFDKTSSRIVFEVKKISEDELTTTYTTLEVALSEAVSGEKVNLNGKVTITENLTIPEGVIVIADDVSSGDAIEVKGVTLTIDGTLDMAEETFAISKNSKNSTDGKIIVNNIIKDVAAANTENKEVAGAYFAGKIGEDDDNTSYITSIPVAAENSATTDRIDINGNVSMNDVTFTAGENPLTISIINDGDKNIATAGTITLVGEVHFDIDNGTFTGTIASEVTSGTSSIQFNKIRDVSVYIDPEDDGETTTYTMNIATATNSVFTDGVATISGTVYLGGNLSIDMLNVPAGSTLVIPEKTNLVTEGNPGFKVNTVAKDTPLLTEEFIGAVSGLVVDGTITVQGSLLAYAATINGTLSVEKTATAVNLVVSYVSGTITVEDKADVNYGLMLLDGSMAGAADGGIETLAANAALVAYPGSDLSEAKINYDGSDKTSAEITVFYVNGDEYATIYATAGVPVEVLSLVADVPGYETDSAKYYSDAGTTQQIVSGEVVFWTGTNIENLSDLFTAMGSISIKDSSADIGTYEDVYVTMDPAKVGGTITIYDGMSAYIDGKSVSNFESGDKYLLSVGEHTVDIQIQPGFTGTSVISFNGQTITDGKIVITGDMKEFSLVVSGDISYDSGSSSSDNGMGLTDILLIVLVVMVVILAIVVIMRMMRS